MGQHFSHLSGHLEKLPIYHLNGVLLILKRKLQVVIKEVTGRYNMIAKRYKFSAICHKIKAIGYCHAHQGDIKLRLVN